MIAGPVPKERAWNKAWLATPRLVRFFAVGGLNTLFGYGTYAALLFVGFHYAWAALLATIAGVTFNYFTTGRLVFDHLSRSRLLRFVGVYCFTYLINVVALAVLERFGVDAYVAGLVMIVPMALVSFLLMKHFVFRSERVAH